MKINEYRQNELLFATSVADVVREFLKTSQDFHENLEIVLGECFQLVVEVSKKPLRAASYDVSSDAQVHRTAREVIEGLKNNPHFVSKPIFWLDYGEHFSVEVIHHVENNPGRDVFRLVVRLYFTVV